MVLLPVKLTIEIVQKSINQGKKLNSLNPDITSGVFITEG